MDKYEIRNQQFAEAVQTYGWLRVLRELTPLTQGIDYIGTKKSQRLDICPSYQCSEHKLWEKTGNFELFNDSNGAGYCFKCATRYSPFDIIMEFKRVPFKDAKRLVEQQIGFVAKDNWTPTQMPAPEITQSIPSKKELSEASRLRKQMNDVWEQAVPLYSDEALPAARYLAKRGISSFQCSLNQMIKFHPAMPFYIPLSTSIDDRSAEDKSEREALLQYCNSHPSFVRFYGSPEPTTANMGLHPCLLILVTTPTGEARRIHRIFIDEAGNKASFHHAGFEIKKMMPGGYGLDITGCACYIDEPSLVRGVAEGLETVLAVKQVTNMPMDCAINAGMLKNYVPPHGTKYVFIFEDKDASKTGENSAKEAEERLTNMGYFVLRLSPQIPLGNRKSVDWLDVLAELGELGFPREALAWRELV